MADSPLGRLSLFTTVRDRGKLRLAHNFRRDAIGDHEGRALLYADHPLFAAGATEPPDVYALRMLALAYAYPSLFAPFLRHAMGTMFEVDLDQFLTGFVIDQAYSSLTTFGAKLRPYVSAASSRHHWRALLDVAGAWLAAECVRRADVPVAAIRAVFDDSQTMLRDIGEHIRYLGLVHTYARGKPAALERDGPALRDLIVAAPAATLVYGIGQGLPVWTNQAYELFRTAPAAGHTLVERMLGAVDAHLRQLGIDMAPDAAGVAALTARAAAIDAMAIGTAPLAAGDVLVAKRLMWYTIAFGEDRFFTSLTSHLDRMTNAAYAWLNTLGAGQAPLRARLDAVVAARGAAAAPPPASRKKRAPASPGSDELRPAPTRQRAEPLVPASSATATAAPAPTPTPVRQRQRQRARPLVPASSAPDVRESSPEQSMDDAGDGGGVGIDDYGSADTGAPPRVVATADSPHELPPYERVAAWPADDVPHYTQLWAGLRQMETWGHPFALLGPRPSMDDWWTGICVAWYNSLVADQHAAPPVAAKFWTECGAVAMLLADRTWTFLHVALGIDESWRPLLTTWLAGVRYDYRFDDGNVDFAYFDRFIYRFDMRQPLESSSSLPRRDEFVHTLCSLLAYIIKYSPIVYASADNAVQPDAYVHFIERAQRARQQPEAGGTYATLTPPPPSPASVLSSTYVAPSADDTALSQRMLDALAEAASLSPMTPLPARADGEGDGERGADNELMYMSQIPAETELEIWDRIWRAPDVAPPSPDESSQGASSQPDSRRPAMSYSQPLLPSPRRTVVPRHNPIHAPPPPPPAVRPMSPVLDDEPPAAASPAVRPMSPVLGDDDEPLPLPAASAPSPAAAVLPPSRPLSPDVDIDEPPLPLPALRAPPTPSPAAAPSPTSPPASAASAAAASPAAAPSPPPAVATIDTSAAVQSLLAYARARLPGVVGHLSQVGVDQNGHVVGQPRWKLVATGSK